MKSGIGFGWGSKGGGGALATGILQLQGGVPLDTTLRNVADQAGTLSPLQLSTTQVAIFGNVYGGGLGGGLILGGRSANTGGIWAASVTPDSSNHSFLTDGNYTYLRAAATVFLGTSIDYDEVMISSSLVQIKNNNLVVGTTAASARLHVRGDGTNPVGRFESSAGLNFFTVNNSGQTIWGSAGANEPYIVNYNGTSTESGSGNALRIRQRANINGTLIQYWADGLFNNTTSGDNIAHHFLASGYAGAAGNGNFRMAQFNYTINNSGVQSGVATGIYLRATETTLNSMAHNFIDLGTAAAGSLFSVTNVGAIKVATLANADAPNSSLYFSSDAGRLTWKDAGGTVNNLY